MSSKSYRPPPWWVSALFVFLVISCWITVFYNGGLGGDEKTAPDYITTAVGGHRSAGGWLM